MSGPRQAVPGSYARTVERRWVRLCERAVILSERDWALIEDWHRRGIPLQIVVEAIDAAEERRRRGRGGARPPRGLAYIAPAVEEAWRAVVEGRATAGGAAGDGGPAAAGAAAWRERLDAEPAGSPLRGLLAALLDALDSGEPAREIDARLDREVASAAPEALRREVEEEVAHELETYRGRMRRDTLATTRRCAVVHRLRVRLGLPRLETVALD